MNNQILNQEKLNELKILLKGKELNYETVENTLNEMGFKKAPSVRISKIIKDVADNKLWAELKYNNLNIRLFLNNNNIVV